MSNLRIQGLHNSSARYKRPGLLVSLSTVPIWEHMIRFLTILLAVLNTAAVYAQEESRTLSFFHTHTGKSLDVTYWSRGEYREEAMLQLREFLADWRNGEQFDIDPGLLELLYRLQKASGSTGRFEIISAYRSPETNEMLRKKSNGGVARKSQHLLGKAIDVRLTDVETRALYKTALALQAGGVGYYAESDFVHVDTGRVRRW